MALSLRNPETQAKFSSWLVLTSTALLLLAIVIAMVRGGFNWEERMFVYLSTGKRAPAVFATSFLSLLLSSGAFWFAYASAGERRNPRSRLSWTCFVASAAAITIVCIFLAAYRYNASVVSAG